MMVYEQHIQSIRMTFLHHTKFLIIIATKIPKVVKPSITSHVWYEKLTLAKIASFMQAEPSSLYASVRLTNQEA